MGHYEVLGVRHDADAAEVRRAYLALARRHHPDRSGGDSERMRAVNEAWATLGDPVRRRQYDAARGHPPTAPPNPPTWEAGPWGAAEPLPDLEDDRPLRATVVLPRWAALLPVGLFAASIAVGLVGVVINVPALVGLALMAFVLSCVLFLASPFIALYASQRTTGGGARRPPG